MKAYQCNTVGGSDDLWEAIAAVSMARAAVEYREKNHFNSGMAVQVCDRKTGCVMIDNGQVIKWKSPPKPLRAAEVILLAALELSLHGNETFTEWDLTVAAWKLDKKRFGMRGHGYPDHKRVYMEIAGKKPHNPLCRGWMEKVAPNTFRLTEKGRAKAEELKEGKGS